MLEQRMQTIAFSARIGDEITFGSFTGTLYETDQCVGIEVREQGVFVQRVESIPRWPFAISPIEGLTMKFMPRHKGGGLDVESTFDCWYFPAPKVSRKGRTRIQPPRLMAVAPVNEMTGV